MVDRNGLQNFGLPGSPELLEQSNNGSIVGFECIEIDLSVTRSLSAGTAFVMPEFTADWIYIDNYYEGNVAPSTIRATAIFGVSSSLTSSPLSLFPGLFVRRPMSGLVVENLSASSRILKIFHGIGDADFSVATNQVGIGMGFAAGSINIRNNSQSATGITSFQSSVNLPANTPELIVSNVTNGGGIYNLNAVYGSSSLGGYCSVLHRAGSVAPANPLDGNVLIAGATVAGLPARFLNTELRTVPGGHRLDRISNVAETAGLFSLNYSLTAP